LNLKERIDILTAYGDYGRNKNRFNIPEIFENVIRDLLVEGVKWEKKVFNKKAREIEKNIVIIDTGEKVEAKQFFELKMNKKIEGIIPPFNKLEEKCVYCPSQLNFPAADIIYKEGKELYLIQITIQVKLKKDIKRGALNDLFKILEITSKNKPDIIHFILCPLPSLKKKLSN